jgi:hypothetical protein
MKNASNKSRSGVTTAEDKKARGGSTQGHFDVETSTWADWPSTRGVASRFVALRTRGSRFAGACRTARAGEVRRREANS